MAVERESVNFKLPKPLVEALREKAKELNTSATELVVEGLNQVLARTDESIDHSTALVLQSLITRIEALEATSIEHRLEKMETSLEYITRSIEQSIESTSSQGQAAQLNSLSEKLEGLTTQLAQLNNALRQIRANINRSGRQFASSQFYPRTVQIQPCSGENLGRRLGVDEVNLAKERESKSEAEFESWSRHRDPNSRGWRFGNDGLYHPIR
jgi:uncharacterized coiled-coil protein SlyX